jgi:hypothetical protein
LSGRRGKIGENVQLHAEAENEREHEYAKRHFTIPAPTLMQPKPVCATSRHVQQQQYQ